MIHTTMGALLQAEAAVQAICGLRLTPKSAYHIKKLATLVAAETKHFHEERDGYIRELGAAKDDGQIQIAPHSAAWHEFVQRLNDLGAVPVELHWRPIELSMLGDEKVSPADLLALGPLFADPVEDPEPTA